MARFPSASEQIASARPAVKQGSHHDTLRPARTAFGPGALDHFKAGLRAFAATLVRRQAVAALARMHDHALADMGLTRADIDAVNRWSLWSDPTQRLADAGSPARAEGGGDVALYLKKNLAASFLLPLREKVDGRSPAG